MTEPRTKNEVLSETAKSKVQEIFNEKELGILPKSFWSKYTDKGLQMEDEAIQFAGNVLGWEMVVKNEERFTNEWITGEPDVLTSNLLADIKCSFDGTTYPLHDQKLKNKSYFWQMQGYMFLTGHEKAELVYTLMNTPLQIVEDEVRRTHWQLGLIEEDLDVRQMVQHKHNFNHIPERLRVKRFIVERCDKSIEHMKEKVEQAREYYNELIKTL
jgi:hypothetical protein